MSCFLCPAICNIVQYTKVLIHVVLHVIFSCYILKGLFIAISIGVALGVILGIGMLTFVYSCYTRYVPKVFFVEKCKKEYTFNTNRLNLMYAFGDLTFT